ncbi:MAG: glucokinase [Bilophila wadsworthia]
MACSRPRPAGPIGIIGAGTGLGTASLIRDSHGSWLPFQPRQACHISFIGKEGGVSGFGAGLRARLLERR